MAKTKAESIGAIEAEKKEITYGILGRLYSGISIVGALDFENTDTNILIGHDTRVLASLVDASNKTIGAIQRKYCELDPNGRPKKEKIVDIDNRGNPVIRGEQILYADNIRKEQANKEIEAHLNKPIPEAEAGKLCPIGKSELRKNPKVNGNTWANIWELVKD